MTCRTEVTGALLSRAAVELLLQHYPLAQVRGLGLGPVLALWWWSERSRGSGRGSPSQPILQGTLWPCFTLPSMHPRCPLPAQVYLRITLSKGRAEMLQLEALENIASCMVSPAHRAGRRV